MFKNILTKVVGDPNERELNRLAPIVEEINALESKFEGLTDEDLRDKTTEFKGRLYAGETMDELIPEAFAVVREASKRTIVLRHFDVQLMGGVVLHQGKVAEMKTGEGKTLVATLPLYLNALEGKGAHLVTVNDYLAKRDTQWMGPIYHMLGLSVGCIQSLAADPECSSLLFDPHYPATDERLLNLRPVSRQEAYGADITYGTNNEFGFDYLRDNMVWDLSQCVQRGHHYAIVDEVDYILIDEARTPLIISGPAEESGENYIRFARLVPRLRPEEGYTVDEKARIATLTEDGISKMESWLGIDNLYSPEHYELTPYLDQALRAQVLFKRDRDYIVKDGQVIIVDEFTGRLMYGRRYSEGLHQAIEAKEGVPIQRESLTLATITFQNYFRMYEKLAGMTGTAATEAEELDKIYDLDVMVIPTHKPMIRLDQPDFVYKTERAKFRAVVKEIEELHKKGQPILVGTIFIEKSEALSDMLKRKGISHQVLNAKHHEKEAHIIAQAGRSGAVTIATNMAGRGVDILLGGNPEELARDILRKRGVELTEITEEQWEEVLREGRAVCGEDKEKVLAWGGLHILGTERHEARRIDNQLRGRSGRQGDPGSSRFYVSLEDDLMRRFGGSTVAGLMDRLGVEEDIPIEHNLVSKSIENAQVKVEGYNFDIRKHLLEYDDVINKQRQLIYDQRREILGEESLRPIIMDMVSEELGDLVGVYAGGHPEEWDLEGLFNAARTILPFPPNLTPRRWEGLSSGEIEDDLLDLAQEYYDEKERRLGRELISQVERLVLLRVVDNLWIRHLTALEELRQGVGLRAFGQRDPLVEFKTEAYGMFQALMANIRQDVARLIYHAEVVRQPAPRPKREVREPGRRRPVATAKAKVGRNDPCPCGSGKKYKHCCLRKEKSKRGH
jgi:preprotein translocase subunit SecA